MVETEKAKLQAKAEKKRERENLFKWAWEYIQQPGRIELIIKTSLGYWAIFSTGLSLMFLTFFVIGKLNGDFNGMSLLFGLLFGFGAFKSWKGLIKYLKVCKGVK